MSDERKTQEHRTPGTPGTPGTPAEAEAEQATGRGDEDESSEPRQVPSPVQSQEESSAPDEAATTTSASDVTTGSPSQESVVRESKTATDQIPPEPKREPKPSGVYFFPDRVVTADEARSLLASDSRDDQAVVVSRLLTYAEYDEIWTWTDRDTVRDLFDDLDLPDRLRAAWARNLGLVTEAG